MATNEPMADERLVEIRRLTATVLGSTIHADFDEATAWFAILDLRREVDRLRAREQALAAENHRLIAERDARQQQVIWRNARIDGLQTMIDAMRPVVEAVAEEMAVYWNRDLHRFCCHRCDAPPTLDMHRIEHEPDCRYHQARAFVAAHPATDTAAGEAESEGE